MSIDPLQVRCRLVEELDRPLEAAPTLRAVAAAFTQKAASSPRRNNGRRFHRALRSRGAAGGLWAPVAWPGLQEA